MKKLSLKFSGFGSWNEARLQKKKEKEELERTQETSMLKLITFVVTLIAMASGMSILPLFPQPLPILLAVLVAFAVYKKPNFGMPVGGALIGLGLLYHLADLYFISFLGDTQARVAFIVIWMTLFVLLPLLFNRYKSALAIDFGILAVVALFFEPAYFLAIPLILASAVFFKKYVGLTLIYYVLLTVPLQLVQYFQYTVLTIVRDDWWIEIGSAPPVLVSLSSIAQDLTSTMSQFRLYDTSQVIYAIAGQTTWVPDWTGRTIGDALTQYLDSLPGILMFVVIVVGLALTLIFFTKMLVQEGIIGHGDRFFPCFTATIAAAIFFVLLNALQIPLAFTADVNATTMVLGILGTTLLTSPVLFMDYSPKKLATSQEVVDKAKVIFNRLLGFEGDLELIKNNIPVVTTSIQGKISVIKESVQLTLKKASLREFDQSYLNEKYTELDKLSIEIDALKTNLDTILLEYQIFSNCEFADWVGKLKLISLNIKTTLNSDHQNIMSIESRVEAIKQIIEAGRELVREVSSIAEPIYVIIRSLYDPELSNESQAIKFAAEKIEKNEAPWLAVEALYNAMNNWARQYGVEMRATMKYLQNSLKPIANLSIKNELLPAVFTENTFKVIDYAKKAECMKVIAEKRLEKEKVELVDVVNLYADLQSFMDMSNDVLSMLYSGLTNYEVTIENLLPTKDYLWAKNGSLRERLEFIIELLSNPSKYRINEIMENLPKYLDYMDEAIQTLTTYAEHKEFLLNYPLAETAITERLKTKERLTPSDLPFHPRFAAEYLRLYYTQRYGEYAFDKENLVLAKRA